MTVHIADCPMCGTNVAIYGEKVNIFKDEMTGKVIKIVKCQRCGQHVPIVIKEG
jgi:endogenous inhibitor of DNA gyrase (YacG/DUF329 family)